MTAVRFSANPAPFGETDREIAARLAYEHLGPVIARYLMLLDAHIRYVGKIGSKVLFMSRGGVRICRLYEEYVAARALAQPRGCDFFWTSRCLTAKAVWNRAPGEALAVFMEVYKRDRVGAACCALLRAVTRAEPSEDFDPATDAPIPQLPEFLESDHALARALVEHLREQGMLFKRYLRETARHNRRVVLVDTGWQGTTQWLLGKGFPEYEWSGLYFGGIPSTRPLASGQSVCLMFHANRFDPNRPESAFVLYRHLIEGMFEPHSQSVEHLGYDPGYGVWAPDSTPLLAESPTLATDPIYCAVAAYLRDVVSSQSLTQLAQRGVESMSRLARILAFPNRQEALALGGLSISVDFGKPVRVPALVEVEDPQNRADRVERSLWRQGQIALEYAAAEVDTRQRSALELPPF